MGCLARAHAGGLFQSRQRLPPGRERAGAILLRNPGEIVAIGRHRRQHSDIAAPRIEREQLSHQHRHRPPIYHNVMVTRREYMDAMISEARKRFLIENLHMQLQDLLNEVSTDLNSLYSANVALLALVLAALALIVGAVGLALR